MLLKLITEKIVEQGYEDGLQPAVKKLGVALETVVGILPTLLSPLRYANEVTNIILENNIKKFSEKLVAIPDNKIIDIAPEIGVPVLEKLSYVRDEDISNLFINLLSTAASEDTVKYAHPGFTSIISSLSVDEARIINYLGMEDLDRIPFIVFEMVNVHGVTTLRSTIRFTSIEQKVELLFSQNEALSIQNLIGNGILEIVDGFMYSQDSELYNELEELHQEIGSIYEKSARTNENVKSLDVLKAAKGYYQLTDYGKSFITACVLK